MNPIKRHQPMSMRVPSGTPVMCMAVTPPERRDCFPTSFGVNPSMDVPTCWFAALMTEMIFEALTE